MPSQGNNVNPQVWMFYDQTYQVTQLDDRHVSIGDALTSDVFISILKNTVVHVQIDDTRDQCLLTDALGMKQILQPNERYAYTTPQGTVTFIFTNKVFDEKTYYIGKRKTLTISQGASKQAEIVLPTIAQESTEICTLLQTRANGWIVHPSTTSVLYVNGHQVTEPTKVLDGDTLWVNFYTFTIEETDMLMIKAHHEYETNLPETAHPTSETKVHYPIYRRTPRMIYEEPDDRVKFSFPSQEVEDNRTPLWMLILPPFVMLLAMIGVMLFIPRGLYIIITMTMLLATITMSITRHFRDKRIAKEKEEKRQRVYNRYLNEKREELHELSEKQRHALNYHFPPFEEVKYMTKHIYARIWEKTPQDEDFMHVSVGRADVHVSFQLSEPGGDLANRDRDHLLEESDKLYKAYETVKDVPLRLNLSRGAIGYVGYPHIVQQEVSQLIGQLAFAHSYHDLRFVAIFHENDYENWAWMKWLPHFQLIGMHARGMIYNDQTRDQLLGSLYEVLRERDLQQESRDQNKRKRFTPHVMFLVADRSLVSEHAIMEYLEGPDKAIDASVLFMTKVEENLSEYVHTVVKAINEREGEIVLQERKAAHQRFQFEPHDEATNEAFARKLFSLDHKLGMIRSIPDKVSFMDLFDAKEARELHIDARWQQNNSAASLSVPVGYKTKDDILELNVHERAHGPHGLLAGTTGSGKSEFLQTYILSLAVNYHPHEVAFLLIDYKGGGMAQPFKDIPHLLGVITNIADSPNFTQRALLSIKSELKKRQRLFDQFSVSHINDYMALYKERQALEPMPHLFLISDEFAELKQEEPDFIKELVSAARIGRSLGVHLLLATQKPAGVVDKQIWSNSRFKVALKVQDEADSKEILKNADAANITETGRGYLQIGNNEQYDLFQAAWSGAPYMQDIVEEENDVARVHDLGLEMISDTQTDQKKKKHEKGITEIEAVTHEIVATTEKMGIQRAPSPWLDPLEERIVQPVWERDDKTIKIPLALADDPEAQAQYPVYYEWMKDTNVAVFGSGGYGKSTTLVTLLLSLAKVVGPDALHYYIFDFGNGALLPLKQLAHTGDYTKMDDDAKIEKMMDFIQEEIEARRELFSKEEVSNIRMYNEVAEAPLPVMYVVIDGYELVKEEFEPLDARYIQIARDGQSYGVFMMITSSQITNVVRAPLRNNMPMKICHYMIGQSEIETVLGRTKLAIEPIPGRCIIARKTSDFAQMYLPVSGDSESEVLEHLKKAIKTVNSQYKQASRPKGMAMLPPVLTLSAFKQDWAQRQGDHVPIGLDEITVQPVYTKFDTHPSCLVIGTPGSGKTNVLKVLISSYLQGEVEEVVLCDGPSYALTKFIQDDRLRTIDTEEETLAWLDDLTETMEARSKLYKAALSNQEPSPIFKPIILVIDNLAKISQNITGDADPYGNSATTRKLSDAVKNGANLGLKVIAAGNTGEFSAGNEFGTELRKVRQGILLVKAGDQTVLKNLQGGKEALKVGMGYYALDGVTTKIKIPDSAVETPAMTTV
ncbi:type VII secretion protein EssC [Bacillus sp. FSL W7-1360]